MRNSNYEKITTNQCLAFECDSIGTIKTNIDECVCIVFCLKDACNIFLEKNI